MISFWGRNWWYGDESVDTRTHLQRRLRFLKAMRDDLETKLAGINAAISSVEKQLSREDRAA